MTKDLYIALTPVQLREASSSLRYVELGRIVGVIASNARRRRRPRALYGQYFRIRARARARLEA